jgi:putative flippase GtrA
LSAAAWGIDFKIVKFGLVGVLNTAADVTVFWALTRAALTPTAANLVSYSCGTAVSFTLNRRWTFRSASARPFRELLKFLLVNLGGLLISTGIVGLGTLAMPPLAAKLLSVPFSFAWNFCLNRYWVFAAGPDVG